MSDEEFTGKYLDGWVSKRFVVPIRDIKKESLLIIRGRRSHYLEQLTINVYLNGKLVHENNYPVGPFTISLEIPPMEQWELEIVASDVFVPKDKGFDEDVRQLSFLLDEFSIPSLGDRMASYAHIFDFKLSKKVHFLEVWDRLSSLLPEKYKIPDKGMLSPLKEVEWWNEIQPRPSSFIRGTVYDKFSGLSLQKAAVQLFNSERKLIKDTSINHEGHYEFDGLGSGDYVVLGKSENYGDQEIKIHIDGYGKAVNIPMLPMF
ncbi:carboxypeptidase-like regulatory domain-containing protein [Effusibacillus consociatus]|uniref:Carboxypeptidase-like regulatory domain-containing protein n=1 Tax=Effusibacillus consociatus TaxID=1117041 RepID=A0ABV9Q5R6_9BACL